MLPCEPDLYAFLYRVQGADQIANSFPARGHASVLSPEAAETRTITAARPQRACVRPSGRPAAAVRRSSSVPAPSRCGGASERTSGDDACCSATALHGSGLSSGAAMAAATSAGVMRAHFGSRYTWPRRCLAGCRTAAADHLLLETMGCAAVGRSFVMSSNSTEAWDAQEWVVTELQHHPCRLFHPYPVHGPGHNT